MACRVLPIPGGRIHDAPKFRIAAFRCCIVASSAKRSACCELGFGFFVAAFWFCRWWGCSPSLADVLGGGESFLRWLRHCGPRSSCCGGMRGRALSMATWAFFKGFFPFDKNFCGDLVPQMLSSPVWVLLELLSSCKYSLFKLGTYFLV